MAGVTQQDIADKLGVSQALVARALKDDPAIAAATRERVRDMAARMGYQPNATARALVTGRTGLVGLWIARAYGTYSAHIIFELERLARADGLDLLITDLGPYGEPDRDISGLRMTVDGLIIADAPWHQESVARRSARAIPCVGIGTVASDRNDAATVNLEVGTAAALDHLRQQGCSRIAYLVPARHPLGDEEARMKIYRKTIAQPEIIYLEEPTRAQARETIRQHVARHGAPDAVFCHNDDYAIGAIRGLKESGLRVPQDVAVVGCDGVEDTEYLECPVSTIAIPLERICGDAWRFLMERIDGYDGEPRANHFDPDLFIRASSSRRA